METALQEARLILASASPRRCELLQYFGIPFTAIASGAPEDDVQGDGALQVQVLARRKGIDIFRRHPAYPVLSADTLVCIGARILGKPQTHGQAAEMLSLLSGQWHQVVTGVCLHTPDGLVLERVETSNVLFKTLGETELERYAQSDEPMDKAGAYAMQGVGSIFIERIDGSPSNVIGLPLCTVGELLAQAGLYRL